MIHRDQKFNQKIKCTMINLQLLLTECFNKIFFNSVHRIRAAVLAVLGNVHIASSNILYNQNIQQGLQLNFATTCGTKDIQ